LYAIASIEVALSRARWRVGNRRPKKLSSTDEFQPPRRSYGHEITKCNRGAVALAQAAGGDREPTINGRLDEVGRQESKGDGLAPQRGSSKNGMQFQLADAGGDVEADLTLQRQRLQRHSPIGSADQNIE